LSERKFFFFIFLTLSFPTLILTNAVIQLIFGIYRLFSKLTC
jgi:hypothetical protein